MKEKTIMDLVFVDPDEIADNGFSLIRINPKNIIPLTNREEIKIHFKSGNDFTFHISKDESYIYEYIEKLNIVLLYKKINEAFCLDKMLQETKQGSFVTWVDNHETHTATCCFFDAKEHKRFQTNFYYKGRLENGIFIPFYVNVSGEDENSIPIDIIFNRGKFIFSDKNKFNLYYYIEDEKYNYKITQEE